MLGLGGLHDLLKSFLIAVLKNINNKLLCTGSPGRYLLF
jgi:hypothetical protein